MKAPECLRQLILLSQFGARSGLDCQSSFLLWCVPNEHGQIELTLARRPCFTPHPTSSPDRWKCWDRPMIPERSTCINRPPEGRVSGGYPAPKDESNSDGRRSPLTSNRVTKSPSDSTFVTASKTIKGCSTFAHTKLTNTHATSSECRYGTHRASPVSVKASHKLPP
jgi:hypothetical protein